MTPRPYFSFSSYRLFGQSPDKWRKHYLLGEEGIQTPAMAFGKEMALIRENGNDEGLEHLTMFLPKYPRREVEMTTVIKVDGKKVILLGKFDGADFKKHLIGEDKTGKSWTQKMADDSEQLTWYAFLYFQRKKIIQKLELNWVATTTQDGKIVATGEVKTFSTLRTHKDFIILLSKINKRWRGITALAEREWKNVL